MPGGAVRSVIYHFYVVDGIRDKVIQNLVIRLCREFERKVSVIPRVTASPLGRLFSSQGTSSTLRITVDKPIKRG